MSLSQRAHFLNHCHEGTAVPFAFQFLPSRQYTNHVINKTKWLLASKNLASNSPFYSCYNICTGYRTTSSAFALSNLILGSSLICNETIAIHYWGYEHTPWNLVTAVSPSQCGHGKAKQCLCIFIPGKCETSQAISKVRVQYGTQKAFGTLHYSLTHSGLLKPNKTYKPERIVLKSSISTSSSWYTTLQTLGVKMIAFQPMLV